MEEGQIKKTIYFCGLLFGFCAAGYLTASGIRWVFKPARHDLVVEVNEPAQPDHAMSSPDSRLLASASDQGEDPTKAILQKAEAPPQPFDMRDNGAAATLTDHSLEVITSSPSAAASFSQLGEPSSAERNGKTAANGNNSASPNGSSSNGYSWDGLAPTGNSNASTASAVVSVPATPTSSTSSTAIVGGTNSPLSVGSGITDQVTTSGFQVSASVGIVNGGTWQTTGGYRVTVGHGSF